MTHSIPGRLCCCREYDADFLGSQIALCGVDSIDELAHASILTVMPYASESFRSIRKYCWVLQPVVIEFWVVCLRVDPEGVMCNCLCRNSANEVHRKIGVLLLSQFHAGRWECSGCLDMPKMAWSRYRDFNSRWIMFARSIVCNIQEARSPCTLWCCPCSLQDAGTVMLAVLSCLHLAML